MGRDIGWWLAAYGTYAARGGVQELLLLHATHRIGGLLEEAVSHSI